MSVGKGRSSGSVDETMSGGYGKKSKTSQRFIYRQGVRGGDWGEIVPLQNLMFNSLPFKR